MKNKSLPSTAASRSLRAALVPFGLFVLGACGGEVEPAPPPQQPAPTLPQEFACEDDDLHVSFPLSGPGLDASTGTLKEPIQEHYLAVTTIIVIKDTSSIARVNELISGMVGPLMEMPGLVAVTFSGSARCGYGRTISVWKDEASMYGFFTSDVHVAAMREAPVISRGTASTHWEVSAQEVNVSWDVARAKLNEALLSR